MVVGNKIPYLNKVEIIFKSQSVALLVAVKIFQLCFHVKYSSVHAAAIWLTVETLAAVCISNACRSGLGPQHTGVLGPRAQQKHWRKGPRSQPAVILNGTFKINL